MNKAFLWGKVVVAAIRDVTDALEKAEAERAAADRLYQQVRKAILCRAKRVFSRQEPQPAARNTLQRRAKTMRGGRT
jgi:hypothetical protein